MTTYGKLHWTVSFSLYVFLAAYLALYLGIVGYFTRRESLQGFRPCFHFPYSGSVSNTSVPFILTGFPWASLGYTQYRTLPLIQIADITGVYGLSFLIAFANVVHLPDHQGDGTERRRRPIRPRSALLLVLLLAATLGYGFYRLNIPERGELLRVALAQGNIPQDVKWDPAFQEATIAVYERLSRQACAGGATWLSGRRAPLPFYLQSDSRICRRIKLLASELKTCLVIGKSRFRNGRGEGPVSEQRISACSGRRDTGAERQDASGSFR